MDKSENIVNTSTDLQKKDTPNPEVFNRESPESKEKGKRKIAAVSAYQGPIPTPEMFIGYKDVAPDMPDRIMKMAEHEDERQTEIVKIEGRKVDGILAIQKRGQLFTLVIIVLLIAVAVFFVVIDKDSAALIAGIVSVIYALKGLFIGKAPSKAKDPDEQEK